MFSESGSSFCFMGVSSNSKVFLSDNDLKGVHNNMEKIHKEECQTLTQEDHQLIRLKQLTVQERDQQEGDNDQEEQKLQRNNIIIVTKPVSPINLKIEIPEKDEDSSNEGFKTPTSSDHKIPVILECPGAPRKTKPRPAAKRKACRRRILLDLSQDLESLFPMPCVVDLGSGGMNKRVKHCDSKTWHQG